MAAVNAAQIVAEAWEHALRTTEAPGLGFVDDLFAEFFGRRRRTYREFLDRPIVNGYGEVVPRIETVRHHLRALGPTRLDPARLR